jgi:hypothetical protein
MKSCVCLSPSWSPYELQQDPKDYLRNVFRSATQPLRQQPQLGRLIVHRLTDDLLMSPIFAERILKTIAGLDPESDLAHVADAESLLRWAFELLPARNKRGRFGEALERPLSRTDPSNFRWGDARGPAPGLQVSFDGPRWPQRWAERTS